MGDVHELANETDKKLAVHEAVCAQRYANIQKRFDDGSKRMKRIEHMLYVIGACVLLGPGAAAELIHKLFGF